MVHSISVVAETPELSLFPEAHPLNSATSLDLQTVINHVAGALSLPVSTIDVTNGNRLQRPAAAFSLVQDLVEQGGLGRLEPNWAGPTDTSVIAQTAEIADPDGSDGANLSLFLAALLA